MEYLCGAVCVLAVIACAAVGAWVILASLFRSPQADGPSPDRFAFCPACDARLAPHSRYCPDCDLDLRGKLAERLGRIAAAEGEVEALRERGELDADTAGRVAEALDDRRRALRSPPRRRPSAPRSAGPARRNNFVTLG